MRHFGYTQSPGGMWRGWIWAGFPKKPGPGPGPGPEPEFDEYTLSDLGEFFGIYKNYPDIDFYTFPPFLSFDLPKNVLSENYLKEKALYHYSISRGGEEEGKLIAGVGIFRVGENVEASTESYFDGVMEPGIFYTPDHEQRKGVFWGGFNAGATVYDRYCKYYESDETILLSSITSDELIPIGDIYIVYHYQNLSSGTHPVEYDVPSLATYGEENDVLNLMRYLRGAWPDDLSKRLNKIFWGWISQKVELPAGYDFLRRGNYTFSDGVERTVTGRSSYAYPVNDYPYLSAPLNKDYLETYKLGMTNHISETGSSVTAPSLGGMFLRQGTGSGTYVFEQAWLYGTASSAPAFSDWFGYTNGSYQPGGEYGIVGIREGLSLLFVPRRFIIKNVPLISRILT